MTSEQNGHINAMTSPDHNGETQIPRGLIPFGEYEWPRSETRQTLSHLFEKIKAGFGAIRDADTISTDERTMISDDVFEGRVRKKLSVILNASLDHEYRDWTVNREDVLGRRLFIHPPMGANILSDWATSRGLPVLSCDRGLVDYADQPCVVIPSLEQYFGRHHDLLANLFDLFGSIASFDGKVLVGCNSWAARFLKQFDDTIVLLGKSDTFPAFDANALAEILKEPIGEEDGPKSVASSQPVFARDDDGSLCDPFFQNLAGRSLGHPWVAIEMFFQGITEAKDQSDDKNLGGSWVELPKTCSIPASGSDTLLFALQTLLIHGSRKTEDLNALLPKRVPNGIWHALERSGFVTVQEDSVSCVIRHYPDIRSELSAAGFNLDKL